MSELNHKAFKQIRDYCECKVAELKARKTLTVWNDCPEYLGINIALIAYMDILDECKETAMDFLIDDSTESNTKFSDD